MRGEGGMRGWREGDVGVIYEHSHPLPNNSRCALLSPFSGGGGGGVEGGRIAGE